MSWRSRLPMVPGEVLDSASAHHQPLGGEERGLHFGVPAVAANRTAGGHDAVIGKPWPLAGAHERADRTRGPRAAGQPGDVAVGGHFARRNPADGLECAGREFSRCGHGRQRGGCASASPSGRPSASGSFVPVSAASVGATSAGVAADGYRPGAMPAPKKTTGTCVS